MSTLETIGLGAVAGFTIFLGLPVGRLRTRSVSFRTFLTGLSAGILVFLLIEVLGESSHLVEEAVEEHEWAEFAGLGSVFVLGLGAGLIGLLALGRMWKRPRKPASMGPGAMAVAEVQAVSDDHRDALRLGMSIAAGIGLHNFSEGLAIGQAANVGETSLALLLVIGFALHNATEGFGIVGPLAAAGVRASWGWLLLAGLIGGGPTFLGTILGASVTSELLYVAFLAMAGGAIIFVVAELFAAGRRLSWTWTVWGTLVGFLLGFGTELVLEVA